MPGVGVGGSGFVGLLHVARAVAAGARDGEPGARPVEDPLPAGAAAAEAGDGGGGRRRGRLRVGVEDPIRW